MGRSASAACEDVSMLVTPSVFSVAAVVIIIAMAMTLENPIPIAVIRADACESRRRLPTGPPQRLALRFYPDILGLLRSLPKKQVRADRGAGDRDQSGEKVAAPCDAGD